MPSARAAARRSSSFDGDVLVFAGRLGPQKALGVALQALAARPDVTLVVAGDGPERAALERRAGELGLDGRVRFLGSVPREAVLRLFRAADASLLPSAWENFPHTVVESLAVGCPVIATAVGGVPEVVRRRRERPARRAGRPRRRSRTRSGASSRTTPYARQLVRGCGSIGGGPCRRRRSSRRSRRELAKAVAGRSGCLMVGRSRYSLPLSPSLAQKFDALSAELDVRVLASAGAGAARDDRASTS